MPLGSRHLVFLHQVDEKNAYMNTDLILIRSFEIPENADIPDSEAAQDLWEEHCTLAPHSPIETHPTDRYLALIPDYLLQWCEHY